MPLQQDYEKAEADAAKASSWIARNPGKTLAIGIAMLCVIVVLAVKAIA